MPIRRSTPFLAALALTGTFATLGAQAADMRPEHAAWLHALSDLRHARWDLTHGPGDAAVSEQEHIAVAETDRAIAEAQRAAERDGKNVLQDEHEDATLDHPGALHHAQDLLIKAKQDVAQPEDNPQARELRERVVAHIDRALDATRHAIRDVEQHR